MISLRTNLDSGDPAGYLRDTLLQPLAPHGGYEALSNDGYDTLPTEDKADRQQEFFAASGAPAGIIAGALAEDLQAVVAANKLADLEGVCSTAATNTADDVNDTITPPITQAEKDACFAREARVATARGAIPIDHVVVEDEVVVPLDTDPHGPRESRRVEAIHRNPRTTEINFKSRAKCGSAQSIFNLFDFNEAG